MLENTVYDKVYKTMLHDRPKWIIPMINEVFHEQYKGEERIEFLEGTHYIKDVDGKLVERATDSFFKVMDDREKAFHLEAQSTPDTTMVQRVYEYDSAIAYKYRSMDGGDMTVQFPPSAVIFLRQTKTTPDVMRIVVKTSHGAAIQEVAVMKLRNYTLEEILEKKLFILIPFYIFVYENDFILYNGSEVLMKELKVTFYGIANYLNELVENKELDAYDRYFLINMTVKVVENLAEKYEHVVKGVIEAMTGKKLEYLSREEFYKIRNEGLAAGREEGLAAGREEGLAAGREEGRSEGMVTGERKAYLTMFKEGFITLAEVAKRLNISEEMVKTYL